MTTGDGRFDPVFDSQGTFRVVLDAMARPGTIGRLPARDPRCPVPRVAAAAALLLTLLDHEVGFAVVPAAGAGGDAEPGDAERVGAHLAAATGSRRVAAEDADYVLALGTPPAGLPLALRRGTPAFPDEGATLIALVPAVAPGAAGAGGAVALTGPGVRAGTTLRVAGWSRHDLAGLAAANAEPPLGVDLILVDAAGAVACLPRSTRLAPTEQAVGSGR